MKKPVLIILLVLAALAALNFKSCAQGHLFAAVLNGQVKKADFMLRFVPVDTKLPYRWWQGNGGMIDFKRMLGALLFGHELGGLEGATPLGAAISGTVNPSQEMIAFLLDKGADPDRCGFRANESYSKYDESPLAQAVNNHNVQAVRLLLERGADPDKACLVTPQESAWERKNLKVLRQFLMHRTPAVASLSAAKAYEGILFRFPPAERQKILGQNALFCEDVPCLEELGSAGLDPNVSLNPSGQTPLIRALLAHNKPLLNALLEYGVDLNKPDENGQTALFYTEKPEEVLLLLEYGADTAVPDKSGKTAYDNARERNRNELAETLKF